MCARWRAICLKFVAVFAAYQKFRAQSALRLCRFPGQPLRQVHINSDIKTGTRVRASVRMLREAHKEAA